MYIFIIDDISTNRHVWAYFVFYFLINVDSTFDQRFSYVTLELITTQYMHVHDNCLYNK